MPKESSSGSAQRRKLNKWENFLTAEIIMDGFCLNWEDSKPGRKIPFSILDQFKFFFFSPESSLVHILHWHTFPLCIKVRYPPSVQFKLYFIRVECDVQQTEQKLAFCLLLSKGPRGTIKEFRTP